MKRMKKFAAIALTLCMLVALVPTIAMASEDDFDVADTFASQIGDAKVNVLVTPGAGDVALTNFCRPAMYFACGTGFREYTATAKEGWVFDTWTYNQVFRKPLTSTAHDLGNRTDFECVNTRYSFSNLGPDWRTPYEDGPVISVNRLSPIGETFANPITYTLYAHFNPIVTVIANEGGEVTPLGENEVKFGADFAVDVVPDEDHVVEAILVDDEVIAEGPFGGPGTLPLTDVRKPTTVEVVFAEKEVDPETPNPEKPDPEKPDPEKPDPEKPDPEKPNPEKPDPEKPTPEKPDTTDKPDSEKPADKDETPNTGDNSSIALAAVLAASAAAGAVVLKKKVSDR